MMPKRRNAATVKAYMFSVPHLVVLFIVVLVFFGPHKLPELARGLGKLMAEFRKASNDFKMAFEEEMRNIERQNREAEWKKSQEEAEAKRQKELAGSPAGEEAQTAPKILPEHTAASGSAALAVGPVVAPVDEAVARDSEASEFSTETAVFPEVPAEEATSSDSGSSSLAHDQPSNQPTHQPNDQRQPA
jgi:TatA/E family protein of Tat protein translocase